MARSKTRRIEIFATALFAALLTPAIARANHPYATCAQTWSYAQIPSKSYVRAVATLERVEGASSTEYLSRMEARSAPKGDVLISIPHGVTLATGNYRVSLWLEIFAGLEDASPSAATLAAWPANRTFSTFEVGEVFSCGGAGPEISSTPSTSGQAGVLYSYSPSASQPGAGQIRFSLISGPIGMQISDELVSPELVWEPLPGQTGRFVAIIKAEDTATGSFDTQGVEIVIAN